MAEVRSVKIHCETLGREVTIDVKDINFDGWENCGVCCGDCHGGASMAFDCPCGTRHYIELSSW